MILGISVAFITRVQRDTQHNIQSIVELGFVWKVSRSATLYMVWSFFIWKTLRDPSVFFFCFLRFWLAEEGREREKLSQWLWKKSHLDWPERLDILRYDFVFVFLLLKCVATSIRFCYLPSKISLISIFRDSALYDIILNLISVEIYRFQKINIEKHREQSNGIHLKLDQNLYKPIHLLWFQLRFFSKMMMNIILSCSFRIQFRFEFEIYFKDSLFYSHKRLHLRISIGVQFARCIYVYLTTTKNLWIMKKNLFFIASPFVSVEWAVDGETCFSFLSNFQKTQNDDCMRWTQQ